MVRRDRLVRLLLQSADVPLVLVRAPAGYGKTTLLCQWAQRDDRPFLWASDEDAALDLLSELERPSVVVVDDLDRGGEGASIEALLEALPSGSQVALGTRAEPALPLGRLRAHGRLLEIGASEPAMTRREAAAMLSMAGAELEPGDLIALVRHSEGWPAALRLAALSLRARDGAVGAASFAGDDRLLADYLRDEVLSTLPPATVEFLLGSSILERLEGGI